MRLEEVALSIDGRELRTALRAVFVGRDTLRGDLRRSADFANAILSLLDKRVITGELGSL